MDRETQIQILSEVIADFSADNRVTLTVDEIEKLAERIYDAYGSFYEFSGMPGSFIDSRPETESEKQLKLANKKIDKLELLISQAGLLTESVAVGSSHYSTTQLSVDEAIERLFGNRWMK